MQLVGALGMEIKINHTHGFYHMPALDSWSFVGQGRAPAQPHPASLTNNPDLLSLSFWSEPTYLPAAHMIIYQTTFRETLWSSLLPVIHESSKRVSQTLQEIYSSEWDGHEELKAIVGVRVFWALELFTSPPCPHFSFTVASPSKQTGKHSSHLWTCVHIVHLCIPVTGDRKMLQL